MVKNLPTMHETRVRSGSGRFSGEGSGDPLQYSYLDGQRILAGYSPWGHKELDMTERLTLTHTHLWDRHKKVWIMVWSLGWEDPLEKGMATHSSILAWRSPWTEKPGRLLSMGLQRVRHDWGTNTFTLLFHFLSSWKLYNPQSAKLLFLAISPQWYLWSGKRTMPFFLTHFATDRLKE